MGGGDSLRWFHRYNLSNQEPEATRVMLGLAAGEVSEEPLAVWLGGKCRLWES